jgi:hypothetical protein
LPIAHSTVAPFVIFIMTVATSSPRVVLVDALREPVSAMYAQDPGPITANRITLMPPETGSPWSPEAWRRGVCVPIELAEELVAVVWRARKQSRRCQNP